MSRTTQLSMSCVSSRMLGIYLVTISTLQMTWYGYLYFGSPVDNGSLKYQVLDPRVLWSSLEWGSDLAHFNFAGSLTALWVLAIGVAFILGRLPFKTYFVSELILGAPQLLVALPWGLLMVSEAPGEGIVTSSTPAILVFFFTLVPMAWAIYLAIYGESDKGDLDDRR